MVFGTSAAQYYSKGCVHPEPFVLISCCEYKSEKKRKEKVTISFKGNLNVVIFLMEKSQSKMEHV